MKSTGDLFGDLEKPVRALVGNTSVRAGDRVRLRPRGGSDALDLVLGGRSAVVDAIEADVEGRVFLAVILDDDPGRDLGAQGRPGHRFYYREDEVEALPAGEGAGRGD
jgi:hypothetical protein